MCYIRLALDIRDSNAIHAANEGLDPDLEVSLVSALTDLVQWISNDTQETLAREAIAQYDPHFERLLATTCSEVMSLLLATMPSELRFPALTEKLFLSMENMGPLAYTEEGYAILKAGMTNAKDTMPLLKPHARIGGHHSSVLGPGVQWSNAPFSTPRSWYEETWSSLL